VEDEGSVIDAMAWQALHSFVFSSGSVGNAGGWHAAGRLHTTNPSPSKYKTMTRTYFPFDPFYAFRKKEIIIHSLRLTIPSNKFRRRKAPVSKYIPSHTSDRLARNSQ
jgi:hypothetical protein